MMKIEGTYRVQSENNFYPVYLEDSGLDEFHTPEKLLPSALDRPTLEIKQPGEEWVFTTYNEDWTVSSKRNFILGETYAETMPNGDSHQSRTTREGNTFKTVTSIPHIAGYNSNDLVRVYKFTESGMELTMHNTVDDTRGIKRTYSYDGIIRA